MAQQNQKNPDRGLEGKVPPSQGDSLSVIGGDRYRKPRDDNKSGSKGGAGNVHGGPYNDYPGR